MDSQHVKGTETLIKIAQHHFCQIFLTLWKKISSTNSKSIISKSKKIFSIFLCVSRICINVWMLWNKRWASEVICFWNYRRQKAGLHKSLKSLVSKHLWTVIIFKGPKECLSLHGSIFVTFLDQSERKSAWKILF